MEISKRELEQEAIEYQKHVDQLDRFAGLAMQAMIASGDYDLSDAQLAKAAYKKAVAMMSARDEWI
jgi:hypothetical protein